MAMKLKTRLFKVSAGNFSVIGIEAASAEDALAQAKANSQVFKNHSPDNVTSEPIYEASIGIDSDYEDNESDDAVFEIVIRGTSEKAIEKIKHALAYIIPGPHCYDEDFDENLIGNPAMLINELSNLSVNCL